MSATARSRSRSMPTVASRGHRSGPAAPAVIDGALMGSEIRGNVRRKTLTDDGLTGTLVAKLSGDTVEGTLSLAEANAAIVRDGKLSLKKK